MMYLINTLYMYLIKYIQNMIQKFIYNDFIVTQQHIMTIYNVLKTIYKGTIGCSYEASAAASADRC